MERINTGTKSVDLHGSGKHGFRAGDAQVGTAPTQISAAFCNAVQEEIAQAVEGSGQELAVETYDQLLRAILLLGRNWTPDALSAYGSPRTFRTSYHNGEPDTWLAHDSIDNSINVASGATGSCVFSVPDNCAFTGQVHLIIVRTDLSSSQAAVQMAFAGRCVSGSTTLATSTLLLGDFGTLAIDMTWMSASGTNLSMNAAFNSSPAAKKYNMSARWMLNNVTQFVA